MSSAAELRQISMYRVLAEEAPECAEPGETSITRAKETIDDDREVACERGFGEI